MPRGMKGTGAGRRGRPSALARLSTSDLRRELERRQAMAADLIRQRDALTAELQELEVAFGPTSAINGFLAAARRKRGRPRGSGAARPAMARAAVGRPRNPNSLVEMLRKTLAGNTMSVTEAANAVQRAGYKTKSGNFRVIVNQALLSNSKLFRKVARGEYTAR
jgi:hypothetical protein